MSIQRKYKVTTSVTQYMWATSREDALKYQEELFRKENSLRSSTVTVK